MDQLPIEEDAEDSSSSVPMRTDDCDSKASNSDRNNEKTVVLPPVEEAKESPAGKVASLQLQKPVKKEQKSSLRSSLSGRSSRNKKISTMSMSVGSSGFGSQRASKYKPDGLAFQHKQTKYNPQQVPHVTH
ncbi:MAG: hypothetical protein JST59_00560 [Actinobacteria bacterium]|nr:hypothetical protein [Actinomycetota bacterium]